MLQIGKDSVMDDSKAEWIARVLGVSLAAHPVTAPTQDRDPKADLDAFKASALGAWTETKLIINAKLNALRKTMERQAVGLDYDFAAQAMQRILTDPNILAFEKSISDFDAAKPEIRSSKAAALSAQAAAVQKSFADQEIASLASENPFGVDADIPSLIVNAARRIEKTLAETPA
jgi:hypothetical protein